MKFAADPGDPQRAAHSVIIMMTRDHLSRRAAARRLGIRRSTLLAWNDCGLGPIPDERGRYSVDVVTAWADEMSAAVSTMVRC